MVTRDGFQTAPEVYSVEEKLKIINMVVDAGVKAIEVGAFSTYETMYKMKDTDEVFKRLTQVPGVEYIKEIVAAFVDAGANQISLSDSAGLGNPRLIYSRVMKLRECFPDMDWMLHMHNTRGMGLTNVEATMRAGIDKIDTSLAGLGGCPYIKGATKTSPPRTPFSCWAAWV